MENEENDEEEVKDGPVKRKRGRPKSTKDPKAREFCCEHCGKTFKQLNVFRVHTRIHTGERPYQCELCGMSFNQIGTLKDHQKNSYWGEAPPMSTLPIPIHQQDKTNTSYSYTYWRKAL